MRPGAPSDRGEPGGAAAGNSRNPAPSLVSKGRMLHLIRRLYIAAPFLVALLLSACAPDPGRAFIESIERATGKSAYLKREAVALDLNLQFGGKDRVVGTMIFETNGDRSRIDFSDGTIMLFDGKDAMISPENHPAPKPRFELLTWPYFVELPFKLNDPGTFLEIESSRTTDGREMPTARLRFAEDIGDTPDDWYLLYKDPTTDLLDTVGYIVTYGRSAAEGEKKPHSIVYSKYVPVQGVQFATDWKFYNWSAERGISGEPIGRATLSDIRFVKLTAETFRRPDSYRIDLLPATK